MDRLLSYVKHYYEDKAKMPTLSYEEQEELDLLEQIDNDVDITKKGALSKANYHDVTIALITPFGKETIFHKVDKSVYALDLKKLTKLEDCYRIADALLELEDAKMLPIVFNMPFEYDPNGEEIQKIKSAGVEDALKELHKVLKDTICHTEESLAAFMQLLTLVPDYYSIMDVLITICALKIISLDDMYYTNNAEDPLKPEKSYIGRSPGAYRDSTISYEDQDRANYSFYVLRGTGERITALKELRKKKEKDIKNIQKRGEKVTQYIKSLDLSKPIDMTQSTYNSIVDEKIRYMVLRFILIHNAKFQNQTVERLKQEETKSRIEKIFKNSCISFDSLRDEDKDRLTRYGNIDNMEKIMTLLTESGLKIYNASYPICDILILSTPAIVSTINKMIKSNVISQEFVKRNPSIFVKDINEEIMESASIKEASFDRIVGNVNLLRDNKIDAFAISKSKNSNALLQDKEQLENVLSIIRTYNLKYSSSNNYELFEDTSLVEIIDRFVELGLSRFISNNPKYVSKESFKYLKRMDLCREMGIPLIVDNRLSPKVLDQVFKVGKNVINDEDISEYVPNSVNRFLDANAYKAIYMNKGKANATSIVEELEQYSISDLEYNINGIIISKPKVLRNFTILEQDPECSELSRSQKIFNAIIYGSVLDEQSINIISNVFGTPGEKLVKK